MIRHNSPWPVLEETFKELEPLWQDYPNVLRVMRQAFIDSLVGSLSWPEKEPYLVTGDIKAMWLRDSSGQIEPYLRFIDQDPHLARVVQGIIRRQAKFVLIDAYANAFNPFPNGKTGVFWDQTAKNPWVFERKFALDSLAYPVRLWWLYWKHTGDGQLIEECLPAVKRIIEVMEVEQDHDLRSPYCFRRVFGGRRNTLAPGPVQRCGLVWSGFRPSDDAGRLCYNIPGQMMAAVSLDMIAEWSLSVFNDPTLAARARGIAHQLVEGITTHGLVESSPGTLAWAYEVNGERQHVIMDDANIPSLLSAPFLFFCSAAHPVYLSTRRLVLSTANPYWYRGSQLTGVGSAHTQKHRVWPMAVIMDAMTISNPDQSRKKLAAVAAADANTGWIHESVDGNHPRNFSRAWFGWGNALFAEAVLRLSGFPAISRPPLVQ